MFEEFYYIEIAFEFKKELRFMKLHKLPILLQKIFQYRAVKY